jgi:hypothetical protein
MKPRHIAFVALLVQIISVIPLDSSLIDFSLIEPAFAQTATAIPMNGGGLSAVQFQTKNGSLRVNLPDDAAGGDTISGTVVLDPKGKSESEQGRNEDELNGYVVEVAEQKAPARLGEFKCSMPTGVSEITLILKDKRGTKICSTKVPIQAQPPANPLDKYPNTCMLPPYAQAGWPIQCRGPCDGDFNTSSIKVGDKPAMRLAESPRKIIAECPTDVTGSTTIEMEEGDVVATAPCSILSVQLNCAVSDIERGKSTTLTVTVTGLDNLAQPVKLQINNRSPNIVRLEGGDQQELTLEKQSGTWQQTRAVNAIRSGSFSFVAWILDPPSIKVTPFRARTGRT